MCGVPGAGQVFVERLAAEVVGWDSLTKGVGASDGEIRGGKCMVNMSAW